MENGDNRFLKFLVKTLNKRALFQMYVNTTLSFNHTMYCPLWRWRSQEMWSDIQFSILIHLPLILAFKFIIDVAITTFKTVDKIFNTFKIQDIVHRLFMWMVLNGRGLWHMWHISAAWPLDMVRHFMLYRRTFSDQCNPWPCEHEMGGWEVRTTAVTQIYGICTSSGNTFEILHRNWIFHQFSSTYLEKTLISRKVTP